MNGGSDSMCRLGQFPTAGDISAQILIQCRHRPARLTGCIFDPVYPVLALVSLEGGFRHANVVRSFFHCHEAFGISPLD